MEVKKYTFPFTTLDDEGKEVEMRTATEDDLDEVLEQKDTELPPELAYKRSEYVKSAARSPSEHLHEMAIDEQDVFPGMSYPDAVKRVMARNPNIARLYASENNGKVRVVPIGDFEGKYCDPSALVDSKARSLMDGGECKTYRDAAVRVLTEHRTLAGRYASWVSKPFHRPQPQGEKISLSSQIKAKMEVKARYKKIKEEGLCHG